MFSHPLQKSTSVGNLSRVTATTAEGTDSCSVVGGDGRYDDDDGKDDHRLTVFQIDSWSEESNLNQKQKQSKALSASASPSATYKDDPIHVIVSSLSRMASDHDEEDESVMALPDGIPTEVVILKDPTETSIRGVLRVGCTQS